MKKIIFLLLILIPIKVYAADVKITDFLIDAYIKENGDMEVNELIGVDGTFNWYERDLEYKNYNLTGSDFSNNYLYNATDITDFQVTAFPINNISFDSFNNFTDSFNLVNFALNGESNKYTKVNISNGYRYRIYYYTNNRKVAFYLKYTIKDVAVLHNDIAEVYWTFVPSGFEVDLENIQIKLHLPNIDDSSNFKIWAHGNLTGNITKEDNKTIYANINEVLKGESVDIRTTFDKNLLNNSEVEKQSYVDALEGILEVEEERANEANQLRKKLKKQYNIAKYGSISLTLGIILLGIYFYYKYGKSPKSDYYSKYNREFIDEYNVEVIDYLMNRKISPNAMSASIMNLIYKKNIKVEQILDNKDKEYKFILDNSDNINECEDLLIKFLFDKVGKTDEDGVKSFTTKQLKNYAKGTKTCTTFVNSYTDWKNEVLKVSKEEKFYEKTGKPIIIAVLVFLVTFFFWTYATAVGADYFLISLLSPLAIGFLIFTCFLHKKTQRGADHYTRWKAFKNFLDDFGAFELKELPEIVLWERYLVYATVFGLAKKVEKAMNVKIKEVEAFNYDYYPSFYYINLGDTISSSISNAISSAYQSRATYDNSHSSFSSGGGGGGGFSSGGGFGGGGGGGRFG